MAAVDARTIIASVRDGKGLSERQAKWFADGLASGAVSDAQAGAFAMAVLLNGLSDDGRVALTRAMRDSGEVMSWDLPGAVVDKHSTGGVGDSVSLILAPALAACGVFVPMISGRGLGHTGGTLDKLEAIPGCRTELTEEIFRAVTRDVGCAIVAASDRLAPADRRLYAIRDISGTVESIDLITASILAKKLAGGIGALVLDVKCGSGAFMKTAAGAERLARSLVTAANGAGCKASALITDMNQPLGCSAGNALEILEVMETLTGEAVNQALWDVAAALGGEVLALAGVAPDPDEGADRIDTVLSDGRAAEIFGEMVAAQGGPLDFIDRYPDRLPSAPVMIEILAGRSGYISGIDTGALGMEVVRLGGGRMRAGDRINPSVGFSRLAMIGDRMAPDQPLGFVHAANAADAERATAALRDAYHISDEAPDEPPLILDRIG